MDKSQLPYFIFEYDSRKKDIASIVEFIKNKLVRLNWPTEIIPLEKPYNQTIPTMMKVKKGLYKWDDGTWKSDSYKLRTHIDVSIPRWVLEEFSIGINFTYCEDSDPDFDILRMWCITENQFN